MFNVMSLFSQEKCIKNKHLPTLRVDRVVVSGYKKITKMMALAQNINKSGL